ncbi:MAG: ABC transporter permease [Bacteroidia bacterium]|nr:ABC transporter permease [Bacteroidia bacterium]MBT8277101.1 ABC transporter permease [Bacteroidia bacterium]NNF30565.1 ABC transporter permease [Flavobacteriaceae bacterium]NNK53114.1 ABC transporter permease [Flavobacteriaceae bacterium]NNM08833.1 ABC transporter permease [Flavobacteriaceae bacterium]
MFNIERWQEIFDTIRKNKLRTFLTGLSVASGIFILVVLLGFGQGMTNGVAKEFEQDATNRIAVWTGVTTVEYKGLNPGRFIELKNEDYDLLIKKYEDDIEFKSSVFRIWNGIATYKNESGNYRVEGVYPDYQFIENASLSAGRFLNYDDHNGNEKVIVIGHKVYRDLFGKKEAIGEQVQISGINFKVVGVFTDPGGEREESKVFLPLSTSQRVFAGGNTIRNLGFTLKPQRTFQQAVRQSIIFTNEIQSFLQERHIVAPEDESAIDTWNSLEEAKRYYDLMDMIKLFFWVVGICTIVAGVVGVSNIMLIIVKERTKEIGIRKAIGAQPWSIIGMILHESIFVTAIAGFLGLIFSMALLEVVGPNVEIDYIVNPSVNFNVALTTVIVLIVAGALAGFFPAWRAARIKPIDALRDE